MKTIGLTGGISTGKSTVADLLRQAGVPVIDADAASRWVVEPGEPALQAIVDRFGPSVLTTSGTLDRAALRAIVLADTTARRDLEAITHPAIWAAIDGWLQQQAKASAPFAVVEAALMVETGSWRRHDALLVVSSAPSLQKERLMARNHISSAEADRWLAAQLPLAEKEAVATAVVYNNGDRQALEAAVHTAWQEIILYTSKKSRAIDSED